MASGFKRLVAVRTTVKDLQSSTPYAEPGSPTGLQLADGTIAYRVNIIGTVVIGPDNSDGSAAFVIDDGTGSLLIQSFDRQDLVEDILPGQIVLVVGRPRQLADGVSISPEIVKQTTRAWLLVRTKELEKLTAARLGTGSTRVSNSQPAYSGAMTPSLANTPNQGGIGSSPHPPSSSWPAPRQPVEEEIVIEESQTPERIICDLIKTCDLGSGADAAEVLSKAKVPNGETVIEQLLRNGDIFAVAAGKYKVLE